MNPLAVLEDAYPGSTGQASTLLAELSMSFGDNIEVEVRSDPEQKCTLLYCRLFRETSVIRDCIFLLNSCANHTLLRFSRFEIVGNLGGAKEFLVDDIARSIRKAGLRFAFDESLVYSLSEEEAELTRALIPLSYRKKIEGLGIDWSEAQ